MTPRYQKILCAVDFSVHARAALEAALELAVACDGRVTIVHVYHVPRNVPDGTISALAAAHEAQAHADAWKEEAARRHRVPVDVALREGTPWEQIVALAHDGGHDLIVVGTHGRTGIERVLVGSVAERVVRHAPCHVLVVRPRSL